MMLKPVSVLIADDNELNRWILCEQLQKWTTDISTAQQGQEAWQLLQVRKYTLIFLDLNMPLLNGLELIKKIRAEQGSNSATPAIAITADSDYGQRGTLLAAGFDDCLFKPILLQHIKQIMQSIHINAINEDPSFYVAQIAKKTKMNPEGCQLFLNRLLEEVPNSLFSISMALQEPNFDIAWDIAHKLQGTFSFYGFTDFLPVAASLANNLKHHDAITAKKQIAALELGFSKLVQNKAAMLNTVVADALQDS